LRVKRKLDGKYEPLPEPVSEVGRSLMYPDG